MYELRTKENLETHKLYLINYCNNGMAAMHIAYTPKKETKTCRPTERDRTEWRPRSSCVSICLYFAEKALHLKSHRTNSQPATSENIARWLQHINSISAYTQLMYKLSWLFQPLYFLIL